MRIRLAKKISSNKKEINWIEIFGKSLVNLMRLSR